MQEICLIPHGYEQEQVERFAAEVRPLLADADMLTGARR